MIIGCPKCQTKLKIPDEKVSPEGTKFRCPTCSAVLNVKRPAPKPMDSSFQDVPPAPKPQTPAQAQQPQLQVSRPTITPPKPAPEPEAPAPKPQPQAAAQPAPQSQAAQYQRKAMFAHEDPAVAATMENAIRALGLAPIKAVDGVEAMVTALKERPVLAIIDAALPKINGFDLAKRLRERPELPSLKIMLVSSATDPKRSKRDVAEVDGYVDDTEIATGLGAAIRTALMPKPRQPLPATPSPAPQPMPQPVQQPAPQAAAPSAPSVPAEDEAVAKAKRLARTVLADIALYSPDKVNDAVREGTFTETFDSDLKEGLKLYNNRVPEEVRKQKDYFAEAIENFIEGKRKALGL